MPVGNPIAIESNVGALWGAKQTGRGVPAVAAQKKLRWVDGDLTLQRANATENYADGRRISSGMDFVDTLTGGGSPVIEGQPSEGAWLLAQHWGADAYTAGGGTAPNTHVVTFANSGGRWLTFWKLLGQAVGPMRELYTDCKISQTVIQCMAGQKVLRVTPTILSLDPARIYGSPDPVVADSFEDPFLWTQAEGTFNVDGIAGVAGISEVTLTVTDGFTPVYGDRITPVMLAPGRGTATIALTLSLSDETLPIWNRIHYGVDAPAPGTPPIAAVHYGAVDFTMSYGAGDTLRSFQLEVSKFQYATTASVNVLPGGGEIQLPVGGEARDNGVDPMVQATFINHDAGAY